MRDHLFPHVHHGFRGQALPLVSFHFPPWQIARRCKPRGNVSFSGVVFEIMSALGRNLNFSYNVTIASSSSLKGQGADVNKKHAAELGEEFADISAISIPWASIAQSIEQKKVWLCIIVCVVTMGPLLMFFHLRSPYYDYHGKRGEGGLNSLHTCVWYMYGALLQQGGRHLPEADSGRILVGTWWLVVLVVVTTYCGNLVAFLTFPQYERAVASLDELLERPAGVSWGVLGGSDLADRLESSDDPRMQALFAGAEKHRDQGERLIRAVRLSRHVYLEWKINLVYLMKRQYVSTNSCDFVLAKEDFWEEKLAMAISANNPYLPIINEQIQRMHKVGLISKWLRQYLPAKDRCSAVTKQTAEVVTHVVNLDDLQGSFFLLALGVCGSLVVVAGELAMHRRRLAAERRLVRPYVP
ncbi:ionotropic receptor 93a-like isoform X2 [Bacillus rossius redtenbacheri]|uniref:ionotropic receptor 93a-like isoform X2 n=1 Tax=Bacillus rossius redtenbacheri TaxID=93214 RepID=UPI002FDDE690